MPIVNYNLQEPARAQYVIAAPVTTDINVIAPTGYTVVGLANKTLAAGLKVTITLDGTNYVVTDGYFELPPPTGVLGTILTGLSLVTNAAITAADTVLIAFGKLQAQITALIARVLTLEEQLNPRYSWYWRKDWEGGGTTVAQLISDEVLATLSSGTFASVAGEAGRVGIIALGVSTNTSNVSLGTQISSIVLGAGETMIEHAIRIQTLPTVAEDYSLRIGLGTNAALDGTDAAFFKLSNVSNSGQWQLITLAANSPTVVNTTITPTINVWYRLTIVVNAANTLATFYIDGVSVGTISTTLPTAPVGVIAALRKLAGNTARTVQLDYSMGYIKFTTPR